MAKTNNSNISADDIQKTKQYTDAIDALNKSLNGINSTLPQFANGMDTGLKALASKLPDVVSAMGKLNAQNKELAANGQKPISVFAQLASSLLSWNGLVSVGVTLLTTYGGTIINWVADMIKGKTTLSALTREMQNNAIVAKALAQAKLEGSQAAQKELTDLNALYNATKSENVSAEKKIEAAKALKEQWSAAFKGFTEADIVAGKASKSYSALKDQILAITSAEVAKNKVVENSNKILSNTQSIFEERKRNIDILKREKDAQEAVHKAENSRWTNSNWVNLEKNKLEAIQAERAASDNIIYDYTRKNNLLKKENISHNDLIDKTIGKYGVNTKAQNSIPTPTGSSVVANTSGKSSGESDDAEQERVRSIARMAEINLEGYAKEVMAVDNHFNQLKDKYKNNKQTVEQLEKERVAAIEGINKKFQDGDLQKLESYKQELLKIRSNATKTVQQLAIQQVEDEYSAKLKEIAAKETLALQQQRAIAQQQQKLRTENREKEAIELDKALQTEKDTIIKAGEVRALLQQDQINAIQKIKDDAARQESQKKQQDEEAKLTESIQKNQQEGHVGKALQEQLLLMDMQRQAKLNDKQLTEEQIFKIEEEYARKKAAVEDQLMSSKIHAGDRFIDAALKNSKKDSAIYKAAFLAKKATSIADTIISTKHAVMESLKAYAGIPFVGQALGIIQAVFMAGQGAMSIAEIAKQKPGFARGGQFNSDGRGALLSGYSRMDDTNAYLRSGEAVVVSEAMRNPWARNLVSAINVAYGGRDFSVTNPSRGYAIGGIFTDGGNSNRYYNQPMNDQKDLANTIAYQMINNFPPVYVDVKDINTQQNIMAQTINRVNL